jgi:hypothetical protein
VSGTLWEALGITQKDIVGNQNLFNNLLSRNFVQGATMAFKEKILKYILPIPKYTKYDYFIALCTAGCGNITGIDKTLLRYRQHNDQQIGAESGGFVERLFNYRIPSHGDVQREVNTLYITYCEVARRLNSCGASKRNNRSLKDLIKHYESRRMIYEGEKSGLSYIVSNLDRYRRYDSYHSVVADIAHNSI